MNPPAAFGPYRVLHQIGSGALGPVFRSFDTHGDRLLAIKALKLDLVPEDAERLAEAVRAITSRIAHVPGVVPVTDCGTERGATFMAMEYVTDDALDAYLRQSPPLSLAERQALLASAARTIDAAWDSDVSHGSLHPRDLFVGGPGRVTITGFGVAQALESVGAKAPVRHPYSAPERISGGPWDRRADVYALGAIARDVVLRHGVVDVPKSWEQAVARATAERPEDRFQTAGGFAEALAEHTVPSIAVSSTSVTAPAPMVLGPMPDFDRRSDAPARAAPVVDVLAPPDLLRPRESAPVLLAAAPARFPWPAVVAVGIAGVAIGVVGGYAWGVSQAPRQPAAPAVAVAPVTEPPVASPSAAPAPVAETPAPVSAAPVRPRPEVTAATRGRLVVDSRPRDAVVMVDGRAVGQTPTVVEDLSPGMHSVLIQLKGHRSVSSKVAIVPGEQTKLAVSLERLTMMPDSLPRKFR